MPGMPTTRRYRISMTAALLFALAGSPAVAAQKKADGVALARQAYNQGNLEEAIETARAAVADPRTSTEGRIILGRALIERFRRTAQPEDLEAARTALLEATAAPLAPALRVEWLIGSAQALYFEEQFGAAATLLGSLLADPHSEQLVPGGRDRSTGGRPQRTGSRRRAKPRPGEPNMRAFPGGCPRNWNAIPR
jgi:hypothetical protein